MGIHEGLNEQTTGEKLAELAFALHKSPLMVITKTDLAKMIDSALKLNDALKDTHTQLVISEKTS
jgi:Ni2+-binding GTPase involved in maturation of urease and hydrogenase